MIIPLCQLFERLLCMIPNSVRIGGQGYPDTPCWRDANREDHDYPLQAAAHHHLSSSPAPVTAASPTSTIAAASGAGPSSKAARRQMMRTPRDDKRWKILMHGRRQTACDRRLT